MSKLIAALLAATLVLPTMAQAKGPKGCPPGLAKKNPPCVPPGLANKGARYDDDREQDWYGDRYDRIRPGDRFVLNGDEYVVVRSGDGRVVLRRDDTLYRLPRLGDGSDYVRMGDVIVKVDRKTRAVFEIIELADLILS